jgi:hypothetical protein
MGAAGQPLALQLGEIPPRGHRRDAELLLDLGDGHRARAPQELRDRGATRLGQDGPIG